MAHYGEVLDQSYDPSKDDIYPLFTQYFGNPLMTKLKNVEGCSMYIAKVHALLGIEYRYIIAIVYEDKIPLGTQVELKRLPWLSLQTRSLQEEHNIPFHSYIPRRSKQIDKKISLVHRDAKQYTYTVEHLPLIVTLLPKTGTDMEWNNSGTIVTALETYQTIISFKN